MYYEKLKAPAPPSNICLPVLATPSSLNNNVCSFLDSLPSSTGGRLQKAWLLVANIAYGGFHSNDKKPQAQGMPWVFYKHTFVHETTSSGRIVLFHSW